MSETPMFSPLLLVNDPKVSSIEVDLTLPIFDLDLLTLFAMLGVMTFTSDLCQKELKPSPSTLAELHLHSKSFAMCQHKTAELLQSIALRLVIDKRFPSPKEAAAHAAGICDHLDEKANAITRPIIDSLSVEDFARFAAEAAAIANDHSGSSLSTNPDRYTKIFNRIKDGSLPPDIADAILNKLGLDPSQIASIRILNKDTGEITNITPTDDDEEDEKEDKEEDEKSS